MEKAHQCAESVAAMIPLARYRFTFRMNEPVRLPELAGSTLRGAFGYALRQLSCMTKAKECGGCILLAQCPFPAIFAPHELPKPEEMFAASIRQIPVPYAIEPPQDGARTLQAGSALAFNMVLMGNALAQLPLITLAWQRALGRGITGSNSTADLQTVEWLQADAEPVLVYSNDSPALAPHKPLLPIPAFTAPQDVHLNLRTPLRIELDKKALGPQDISAAALLRQLIRRTSLIIQFHCPAAASEVGLLPNAEQAKALNALADAVKEDRRLHWQEWKRYSSRQQQEMLLGGVMGHWLLKDVAVELLPYLYLGQWLHAGKEAAFGLGRYEICAAPWNPRECL
jgi:hypothetical protein